MAHIGVLAPPLQGHLNPLLALATALDARGHEVTFFNIADTEHKIRKAGHRIHVVGRTSYPRGWLPTRQAVTDQLNGLAALLHWNEEGIYLAGQLGPEYARAVAQASVDLLLVDQVDILGGTIAEHLGLPFISVCTSLIANWEAGIPPSFVGAEYANTAEAQAANRLMFNAIQQGFAPLTALINKVRAAWGLPAFASTDSYYSQSPLATISQQLPGFDFPRQALPASFHYTGPLRQTPPPLTRPVPERPNAQPLVYAVLDTPFSGRAAVLEAIAAACAPLEVQLVLAVGPSPDPTLPTELPGRPRLLAAALDTKLLSRAALAITAADLNAVLDCISHGLPLLALPAQFDQPGVAARVSWAGIGVVVPLRYADALTIREAVQTLLADNGYRQRSAALQAQLPAEGGAARAVAIIEDVISYVLPPVTRPVALAAH